MSKYLSVLLTTAIISGNAILVRPVSAHHNSMLSHLKQVASNITVKIEAESPGSGVLIAQEGETYYVLTAKHIVAFEDNYAVVTPDGLSYPLRMEDITFLDSSLDLALLRFTSKQSYSTANFSTFPLSTRQYVFLSGWAVENDDVDASLRQFRAGQVVAPLQALGLTQAPLSQGYSFFYSNPTDPGLSGAPLLDNKGRVVGIHGRAAGTQVYDPDIDRERRVYLGYSSGMATRTFIDVFPGRIKSLLEIEQSPHAPLAYQDLLEIESESAAWLPELSRSANAISWLNYSNLLVRANRIEAALTAIDRSLQLDEDMFLAWYFRSVVMLELNNYSSALTSSDLLIALSPDFYLGWRQRGQILSALGRYDEALAAFDQAIAINADDYISWYLKAEVFGHRLDQVPAALAAYDMALSIEPEFTIAARNQTLLQTSH